MMISTLSRPLFPALLALASCSSSPTQYLMPDAGPEDAGSDAGPTDAGPSDAGPDAGDDAGPPLRTATTRPLLGTSVRNLLLDPFVTTDTSLGHFNGLFLPIVGTTYTTLTLRRAFVSQSPAGVTAPVASSGSLSGVDAAATSVEIVAPFPGGSDPLAAQIWVSVGDAQGSPVPFATGGKGVAVNLLPNDAPTQTYPLTPDGAPPQVFAGREWVRFAPASPVPMAQGGWFSIVVDDVNASFQLQAPEVTPTAMTGAIPPPKAVPRAARESAVLAGYVEVTRRRR